MFLFIHTHPHEIELGLWIQKNILFDQNETRENALVSLCACVWMNVYMDKMMNGLIETFEYNWLFTIVLIWIFQE